MEILKLIYLIKYTKFRKEPNNSLTLWNAVIPNVPWTQMDYLHDYSWYQYLKIGKTWCYRRGNGRDGKWRFLK